jgi:hypothetical protein
VSDSTRGGRGLVVVMMMMVTLRTLHPLFSSARKRAHTSLSHLHFHKRTTTSTCAHTHTHHTRTHTHTHTHTRARADTCAYTSRTHTPPETHLNIPFFSSSQSGPWSCSRVFVRVHHRRYWTCNDMEVRGPHVVCKWWTVL